MPSTLATAPQAALPTAMAPAVTVRFRASPRARTQSGRTCWAARLNTDRHSSHPAPVPQRRPRRHPAAAGRWLRCWAPGRYSYPAPIPGRPVRFTATNAWAAGARTGRSPGPGPRRWAPGWSRRQPLVGVVGGPAAHHGECWCELGQVARFGGQRVERVGDQVGELAGGDAAQPVLLVVECGGAHGVELQRGADAD